MNRKLLTPIYISGLENMSFGKERRAHILKSFDLTENAALYVNCRHRPQLKNDPDLRKLIKQKKLVMHRSKPVWQDLGTTSYTFLTKADYV